MKALHWKLLVFALLLVVGVGAASAQEATPEAPQAGAPSVTVVDYNLGETILIQDRFDEGDRFRELPYQLRGVLAVPQGEGPFPIAMIIHGRHPGCLAPVVNEADAWPCPEEDVIRNWEGFTYLAEALAQHGFVTVVPDTNMLHTVGWGEYDEYLRFTQVMDTYSERLLAANQGEEDFGVDLEGQLDLSRILMIGHSAGGGMSAQFAYDRAQDSFEGVTPIIGLVLIAPALHYPEVPTPNIPMNVIIAQCDGDVGVAQPAVFAEAARDSATHTAVVELTWMPRANHNAFNSILRPEGWTHGPCPNGVMAAEDQQQALTAMVTTFANRLLALPPAVGGPGR